MTGRDILSMLTRAASLRPPAGRGPWIGAFATLVALGLSGCRSGPDARAVQSEVIANYATIVYASYQDAFVGAQDLQEAVHAFLAAPSESGLESAKKAWLAAREPYLQTEAYRFYGGPIDDADGPEPRINSWPLDEAYVDYVEGAPNSGIINDTARYPTLDRDLLVSLNESGAEENISVGYHAIEFLLWGQDLSVDGPGARPYTDYVVGVGPNAERRATYLGVVTDLLVDDLGQMVSAWAPDDPSDYRARFLALDPDDALRDILVGIGVLSKSELAGERLFTAYDNQDQEDEHSCFSDNTNRDVVLDARGIQNVYTGRYERIDGSVVEGLGLDDFLQVVDPESAEELTALIDASVAAVEAIPAPFDRAIVDPESRPLVLDAVYALQDQGDKLAEVGTRLGLTITTALPE